MARGSLLFTVYASFIFGLSTLVFVPLLMLLSINERTHRLALRLHNSWATIVFGLCFIPVKITGRENLRSDQQYIFCGNHFSYLDIPTFFLLHQAKFIGKSSLNKIPFFGFFFKRLHIPVNRSSARSRAESLQKTRQALEGGFNVSIFPEGGMLTPLEKQPYMSPFKDGAFRLAVDLQIPIVPLVIANNFMIMPDTKPFRMKRDICEVKVLAPIYPQSSADDEIKRLKDYTFECIQQELLRYHPDKVGVLS